MKKILFAMVASLATLVSTGSGVNAAFTVTLSINSIPFTPPFGPPAIVNPGLVTSSYNATTNGSDSFDRSIGVNSDQSSTAGALLKTSNLSLTNGTNAPVNLIVTVSQDVYSLTNPAFFNNAFRVKVSDGSIAGGSFAGAATNQLTQTFAFGALVSGTGTSSSNGGSTVSANQVTGPYTITQTYAITNLSAGATITFTNAATSLTSPLPATALMAGLGFPLLGLAGAARRRLFA